MPQAEPSVILIEFNELSPPLMERFLYQGALPNFQRLRQQSHCYITDADGRPPYLEPWIQWVTVHSGVDYREHGISKLDEGHKLKHKCLWDVLSDAGYRVWICGTMNVYYRPGLNGCVLPDPWSSHVEPLPASMAPFHRFVQKNVQEHTNESARSSAKDHLRFLLFLARHGLSASTLQSIARQLLSEWKGVARWRRAALLDQIQFDVFRNYFEKTKPHFSIFFSNSTAHFQHLYWRNMNPQPFRVKPTPEEQSEYADAILFGYRRMDALIGRFLELAGEGTTIIFATALSQQPCLTYEDQGGKCFYRPRDFATFLAFAGVVDFTEVAPVMSEQFYVAFEDERGAQGAEAALGALQLSGTPLLSISRRGASLFCGCRIYTAVPAEAVVEVGDSRRSVPFFDLLYRAEGLKSGMHHPDGMLWIRHPHNQHRVHEPKVPLLSVAPTILDLFAVPTADCMPGQSLLQSEGQRRSVETTG